MACTTNLTAIRHQFFIQAAAIFISSVARAAQIYSAPLFDKIPYHTSALSKEAWLLELIEGHSEWIKTELGMQCYVFLNVGQAIMLSMYYTICTPLYRKTSKNRRDIDHIFSYLHPFCIFNIPTGYGP